MSTDSVEDLRRQISEKDIEIRLIVQGYNEEKRRREDLQETHRRHYHEWQEIEREYIAQINRANHSLTIERSLHTSSRERFAESMNEKQKIMKLLVTNCIMGLVKNIDNPPDASLYTCSMCLREFMKHQHVFTIYCSGCRTSTGSRVLRLYHNKCFKNLLSSDWRWECPTCSREWGSKLQCSYDVRNMVVVPDVRRRSARLANRVVPY